MIYLLIAFLTTAASANSADFGFLAYGDLRGHIEPCGCDPSTDLGGIRRLANVVFRERNIHPELLLFDLGNALPLPHEPDLKSDFILDVQAKIRPNAILFNRLEYLRRQQVGAWSTSHRGQELPYVLSNVLASVDTANLVKEKVTGKGWVAMGYTQPISSTEPLESLSNDLLRKWSKSLIGHEKDERILLFSGRDSELRKITDSGLFTTVISANTGTWEALPGAEDRRHEERLKRVALPPVYMVPLAGQGLLRGGKLQTEEAPSLAALLANAPQKQRIPQSPEWLREGKVITWLDPVSADGSSAVDEIYGAYTKAARDQFLKSASIRSEQLKDSQFAGAQACSTCHAQIYQSYLKSKHAHALRTLEDKNKHEDPECVTCHVLGANEAGGFVNSDLSPQFANVQCENCHGARLKHARDPYRYRSTSKPDKTLCSRCHNQQHSPKFDFGVYWPKIEHKGI